jgi:hypothetical protein
MDFHLHRNGEDAGVFPLTELQRKLISGEISGTDLVWAEGMANWEPVDAVLRRSGLGVPPPVPRPPVPAAPHKPRAPKIVPWVLGLAAIVAVVVGAWFGFVAVKVASQVKRAVQVAQGVGINRTDGLAIANRPIILTTNTLTQADVLKRSREFRVRQYSDAYQKYGDHSTAWDSDARQLLESWLALNYGGGTSNLPSAQLLADKLAADPGCSDPLVLTAAAANASSIHERIRRFERAVAAFSNSPYPGYPKLYATVMLATDLGARSPRLRSLDAAALGYLGQALGDGCLEPRDEQDLADILVEGWGHTFFQRNATAIFKSVRQTKTFPWLTLVLEGEYHIDEAWRARGGGYANSVTQQGWQGFAQHLALARAALTYAWHLHPDRPLAAARMMQVALGDSGAEEMRTWFDRAVEVQVDFPQAWSEMRWGLRPRWYGSHEALLALGARAVDTRRFDTDVPRKLFDCIQDVESELDLPPGNHIYGRPDVWPDLQRMYEGYIAEPTQEKIQPGWRTTYAAVAYLAGHYDIARQQLQALHWQPVSENLTDWGVDLSLMPLQVAAFTGKASALARHAESSYVQFDLPNALSSYTQLSSSPDADEPTRLLCRARLAALTQELALARGDWVDLLPSGTNDPNWVLAGTKLTRLDDGALEVQCGPGGHSFYCRTRLGPAFELSGQVELVRSSNHDFQAGIIFGLPDSYNSPWYAFRLRRNETDGAQASFSRQWGRQQISLPAPVNDQTNSFRFRIDHGRANAWVNGTQVFRDATPVRSLYLTASSVVGLGAFNDMNHTVLRYRDVKVRRLVPGAQVRTGEN